MGRFRSELIALIKQHQLHFRHTRWKEALFMAEEGFSSESFCEMFLSEARRDAERIIDQGNFLWRPPMEDELYAEGKPDIELGHMIEGDQQRIGIQLLDRPRNITISGGAGGGKTVTCRNICINIDMLNQTHPGNPTTLLIFDPKTDYVSLRDRLHREVKIYSPDNNLRVGLNGPIGVPPRMWINQLTMSLAGRDGLFVSRTCLAAVITRLLVALNPGLEEGDLQHASVAKDLTWPPLKMVLEAIQRRDVLDTFSSKADYGRTLIQALSGLIQDSGSLFECCNGLDIHRDIIEKQCHCVFNVVNVPAYIIHLIVDNAINQVMVKKLFNNYKCDHTDEVFLIDEADLLLQSDIDNFPDGLSPLDRLHRLGRELGLMSVISASALQAASKHILRNTFYTCAFNLADAHSVQAACLHLQLDPRCQRMLGSLLPGQCIWHQTQASCNTAIWCQMDYVAPARNMGPIEYTPHPYVPAISLSEAPQVLGGLDAAVEEHKRATERQSQTKRSDSDERPMKLLQLGAANPYVPVVRLFEMLGNIRFEVRKAIRKVLDDSGLAEFEEPRIGRSNMLLMEVTAKGYQAMGLPAPSGNKGRGSISHRHFAHWIKSHFEKMGHEVLLEWVIPGTTHPVDVAVQLENGWHVFEICVTASENVVSHIEACFEGPDLVRRVTIIAATKAKLKELQTSIQADLMFTAHADRVEFDVIENYLT